MLDKDEVRAFFDRLAPTWDAGMVRNEPVIRAILNAARIGPGKYVLDVACGTGVLIPDYLERGVRSVLGVDLSPEMVRIARSKFLGNPHVSILCGDAETTAFGTFDCIMVYNAFPHFADPDRLIRMLSAELAPGGTLTIAHGMSREKLNRHHSGTPSAVSAGLQPIEDLQMRMQPYLTVTDMVSDDSMFLIVGTKEDARAGV